MLTLLAGWLLATADVPRRNTAPPRFVAETRMVVLSATAVDKNGRPVRDLRASDLQVLEQGRPQKVIHFTHARVTQARLLLLVDASGSMSADASVARMRAVVGEILARLDPADQVALAGFDHKYWGVVAFTRDRQAIISGLADLAPFGSTALHDALDKAAQDVASHGEGRRAIVVVTDGVDTASVKTPDEVIAHSKALDVPIYALSVVSPLDDPRAEAFLGRGAQGPAAIGATLLERYAGYSGGAAFVVSEPRRIQESVAQIVEELKHQYRLGYDPPAGPPGFRAVEVRSKRRGVRIRTRTGYMPAS